MHVAIVPVLLESGERIFDHLDGSGGYHCVEFVSSPSVSHVRLKRDPVGRQARLVSR
jgi:hypothetical protein